MGERITEIIEEIEKIQSQRYSNWIAALGRQTRVNRLQKELDKLDYKGKRPPRNWSHLNAGK